jgi:hypothetical protein
MLLLSSRSNSGLAKNMNLRAFEHLNYDRVGSLAAFLCVFGLFGTWFNSPKLRLHGLRGV